MKKIALAVVATLIAPALHAAVIYDADGNKLDLYGSLRARHYFSKNKAIDGDNSFLRLGFKGQTKINDDLTGYGQWEYNFQNSNTEGGSDSQVGNKTRLGFAGLKFSKFGSFDYGRNWGIAYDVASITDIAPIFDDLTYSFADNYMNGRATGLATYRNNGFFGLIDGLNIGVQYQGANDESTANARGEKQSNGDGYGFSASYTTDFDVSVLGTYTNSDRTNNQQVTSLKYGSGDRAEMWSAGVKYDHQGIYLAGLYGETLNMTPISSAGFANKTQDYEAVASYLFDFGLKPLVGYFQSKAKDVEGVGDADLVKYYIVSTTYYFNKNMNAYVDYKINRLDSDNKLGIASNNQVGVGLNYQF